MKTSAAYDLSQFARETETETKVRVVKTKHSKNRAKKALAVKVVLYLCTLTLLMAGTVYSRMVLTETRNAVNTYTDRLTELESKNAYLNYKLESIVSLKSAEQYAVGELGLVKLDASRIEYVDLQNENVIDANKSSVSMSDAFKEMFDSVIDFIGA